MKKVYLREIDPYATFIRVQRGTTVFYFLAIIIGILNSQNSFSAQDIPASFTNDALKEQVLSEPKKKLKLLLTFDDGPHVLRTPRVLDILDTYKVKAIFFINGERFLSSSEHAQKAKNVLKDILTRGHTLGNHTVHHDMKLCKRLPEFIEKEITQNSVLIEEITGQSTTLFRAPFGFQCHPLQKIIRKLGLTHLLWDIDSWDWKLRNRHANFKEIQKGISLVMGQQTPQVLLMHDIHEESVQTLPLLLDWLKNNPEISIISPDEFLQKE